MKNCPLCFQPPEIADVSQPFSPAKFDVFHNCDACDVYFELWSSYQTQEEAALAWDEFVGKLMAIEPDNNAKLPELKPLSNLMSKEELAERLK
jgi:hypothetical protein